MATNVSVFVVSALFLAVPPFAEDKFFNSNGVQIRYIDEGAGEPVILLHGFRGSIERWTVETRIFHELRQEYRVIAFDSRGNG
jgi:pimeloyl-ACP methyl ester carboxylesterase